MKYDLAEPLQRKLDIAVASLGLIVLAPLFTIIALLILLEDGWPIFFRQCRVGWHGASFRILKFRTMKHQTSGLKITAGGDSRVTKLGGWLRRLKIDELPQLVNILRGDMSLIGPRPEVPEYVEARADTWRRVLAVRPGLTDLASLAFRDEEAILGAAVDPEAYYRSVLLPAKLRLNAQYQKSRSLALDLKLLWMTARYSFFPRGFTRERILKSLTTEAGEFRVESNFGAAGK
jgi:lipopolysaccharide/colanic/teichoic acid biosynthesis glycosyltransferase